MGVKKVLPGHILTLSSDGSIRVQAYWKPESAGPSLEYLTDQRAIAVTAEALLDSVRANMIADVPVGAYLSGGIDSSLIVAMMRSESAAAIRTYTAGFGDPRFDEVEHAQMTADALGCIHSNVSVTPEDFARLWLPMTWHRDAPLSEPADIAVNMIAAKASQDIKVVLSGEGADELFGGYPKHRLAGFGKLASAAPPRLRGSIANSLQSRVPLQMNRARIAIRALGEPTATDISRGWFHHLQQLNGENSLERSRVERVWTHLSRADQVRCGKCCLWMSADGCPTTY